MPSRSKFTKRPKSAPESPGFIAFRESFARAVEQHQRDLEAASKSTAPPAAVARHVEESSRRLSRTAAELRKRGWMGRIDSAPKKTATEPKQAAPRASKYPTLAEFEAMTSGPAATKFYRDNRAQIVAEEGQRQLDTREAEKANK